MTDQKVRKFTIDIPQAPLTDLKHRLKNTHFPDEEKDSGWKNGTSLTYMKELVRYWLHKYKWRKHEKYLNTFSHFITSIDDTKIHFIHEKSDTPGAPALILTHGWPDSFFRFHKVIPLLKKEFHVIVPSLPGFGFSDKKPMDSTKIASLWAKLMKDALGYETFYAAGGDIGSLVSRALATNHEDMVKGIYLTDIGYPTGKEDNLSKAEQAFAEFVQKWLFTKGAYAMVHNTKPQSIAYGLSDSPSGLAGWIISMIDIGADKNDVEKAFGSREELITNIMIYLVTQTAASSVISYAEETRAMYQGMYNPFKKPKKPNSVPAAISVYPREAPVPQEWAERFVTVKRFKKMSKGGHFVALEEPELFAEDVIAAFKEIAP
jgi:pimeloyl-ACP methyl ester carboxylesterase